MFKVYFVGVVTCYCYSDLKSKLDVLDIVCERSGCVCEIIDGKLEIDKGGKLVGKLEIDFTWDEFKVALRGLTECYVICENVFECKVVASDCTKEQYDNLIATLEHEKKVKLAELLNKESRNSYDIADMHGLITQLHNETNETALLKAKEYIKHNDIHVTRLADGAVARFIWRPCLIEDEICTEEHNHIGAVAYVNNEHRTGYFVLESWKQPKQSESGAKLYIMAHTKKQGDKNG